MIPSEPRKHPADDPSPGTTSGEAADLREALRLRQRAPEPEPRDVEALLEVFAAPEGAREALLADDPEARRLWLDLAATQADEERGLSARAREALLRAFERQQAVEAVAAPARPAVLRAVDRSPTRVVRATRRGFAWKRAAAVLLLGLGALWAATPAAEAGPGLRLSAVLHLEPAAGGWFSRVEFGRFAPIGADFAPAPQRWTSLATLPDNRVVVGAGDRVTVARALAAERGCLRLERGEARLEARSGSPVELILGEEGLLVLEIGHAHVALATPGTGSPALALLEGARARYEVPDGAALELAGPCRVLLDPSGALAYGEPALSLFRELRFFGGDLPQPAPLAALSPRLWNARQGEVLRQRRHLELRGRGPWALEFVPPESLAGATRLSLGVRAPAGTRVLLEGLAADGGDLAVVLGAEASRGEPGASDVSVALPPGWHGRLPRAGLVLGIVAPAGAASGLRFEGATLGFDTAPASPEQSPR